ncbi:MAG: cyclodeaminase/cyclohydrolase family protein [Chloroflexota bacterium]
MQEGASPEFRSLTVAAFVDRLASSDPVPGGGSASAIAAGLGAGLVAMVAALSQDRPRFVDHADLLEWAGREGRRLADRFLRLADEDAIAYAAFRTAAKLPKATEADRSARVAAMRSAARGAADVPLECVRACLELVSAAESLAGRSNPNASSDLNVAALLAEAAAHGAAANVIVNLPSLGDEALAGEMRSTVVGLIADIEQLAAETREIVERGAERAPIPAPGGV